MFSLPLQVGAVRLGTLDLNRASSGPMSREQLAGALALVELATEALLELAEHPDPSADDPAQDDAGADPMPRQAAGWLPDVHADVHVASGMVSARLGIDVGTGMLRLRAHAFASSEPISEVARRIIDRSLVLDDSGDTHSSSHALLAAEPEGREQVAQRPPVQRPSQHRGGVVAAGQLGSSQMTV